MSISKLDIGETLILNLFSVWSFTKQTIPLAANLPVFVDCRIPSGRWKSYIIFYLFQKRANFYVFVFIKATNFVLLSSSITRYKRRNYIDFLVIIKLLIYLSTLPYSLRTTACIRLNDKVCLHTTINEPRKRRGESSISLT